MDGTMFTGPKISASCGVAGPSGQPTLSQYAFFSVPLTSAASASSSDCGDKCQTPSSPAAELQEADSEASTGVVGDSSYARRSGQCIHDPCALTGKAAGSQMQDSYPPAGAGDHPGSELIQFKRPTPRRSGSHLLLKRMILITIHPLTSAVTVTAVSDLGGINDKPMQPRLPSFRPTQYGKTQRDFQLSW